MRAEADDRIVERDQKFETDLFIHDRQAWSAVFPSEEMIDEGEENWMTADDPGFDDFLAEMGLVLDD